MDLFDHLKQEHEQVKKTLERLMTSTSRGAKSRTSGMDQLRKLLLPHMEAEEGLFYPALIEQGKSELGLEAMEEHRVARRIMEDIQDVEPADEHWHARLKVLCDVIEHHIEEEESQVFDAAREVFDADRLEEMADQFLGREKQVKQSM